MQTRITTARGFLPTLRGGAPGEAHWRCGITGSGDDVGESRTALGEEIENGNSRSAAGSAVIRVAWLARTSLSTGSEPITAALREMRKQQD